MPIGARAELGRSARVVREWFGSRTAPCAGHRTTKSLSHKPDRSPRTGAEESSLGRQPQEAVGVYPGP